jgi:hypothetical protein
VSGRASNTLIISQVRGPLQEAMRGVMGRRDVIILNRLHCRKVHLSATGLGFFATGPAGDLFMSILMKIVSRMPARKMQAVITMTHMIGT